MKIHKPVEDKSIKGIKPVQAAKLSGGHEGISDAGTHRKAPKGMNLASHGQHRRSVNKHGNRHNGPQESLNPPFEKL